jgi:hypothetical protein
LLPLWEISYRQSDVIQMVELWQQVGRFFQRDAYVARLTAQLLDLLVHRIEAGPCEVRLGVGQSLGIIGASRFADGEVAFALQVCY